MDNFSFGSSDSSRGTINRETISESIQLIKRQAMIQHQELLLQTLNEKCFKMCVTSPGTSLDGSQQKCLAKCVDRYIEAWNSVSRAVTNKIREQADMM